MIKTQVENLNFSFSLFSMSDTNSLATARTTNPHLICTAGGITALKTTKTTKITKN